MIFLAVTVFTLLFGKVQAVPTTVDGLSKRATENTTDSISITTAQLRTFCQTMEDLKKVDANAAAAPDVCGTITSNVQNCKVRDLSNPNFCKTCNTGYKKIFFSGLDYCIQTNVDNNASLMVFNDPADGLMCARRYKSDEFKSAKENLFGIQKCSTLSTNDGRDIVFWTNGDKIVSDAGTLYAFDNSDPNAAAAMLWKKPREISTETGTENVDDYPGWNRECTKEGNENFKIKCNFGSSFLHAGRLGGNSVGAFQNDGISFQLVSVMG